jgi:hypothetical protein
MKARSVPEVPICVKTSAMSKLQPARSSCSTVHINTWFFTPPEHNTHLRWCADMKLAFVLCRPQPPPSLCFCAYIRFVAPSFGKQDILRAPSLDSWHKHVLSTTFGVIGLSLLEPCPCWSSHLNSSLFSRSLRYEAAWQFSSSGLVKALNMELHSGNTIFFFEPTLTALSKW